LIRCRNRNFLNKIDIDDLLRLEFGLWNFLFYSEIDDVLLLRGWSRRRRNRWANCASWTLRALWNGRLNDLGLRVRNWNVHALYNWIRNRCL